MSDFTVENHGSIMLFRAHNDEARQHLEQSVGEEAQWQAGALAVEPRYAQNLADALRLDGFEVA